MHLQIKASPGSTAENFRIVVRALGRAGINIESIAPDFEPPHVRVLVKHFDPYDPANPDDPFNRALQALRDEGLDPTPVPAAELVNMPNKPAALSTAMDVLQDAGFPVESVLVLPGDDADHARVSFGVAVGVDPSWGAMAADLGGRVQAEVDNLPG